MGTLTRKSTTGTPRSSRMPPACQEANRRRHLLNNLASRQVSDLNSHLLSQAIHKQVEGNLRIGEIQNGEVEAGRVVAGKITAGRLAHNRPGAIRVVEDGGMGAVAVGVGAEMDAEEREDVAVVDVEVEGEEKVGAVEEGVMIEDAVVEEDGAADRVVAGAVTGAR